MYFLRRWLLGIVACALLISFAEQLTPSGALRKLVRFTGGLLLMICILQPITQVDMKEVAFDFNAYREAVSAVQLELSDHYESALSDSIAERTGAYIEDKAASLGVSIHAVVGTETVDGAMLPVSAVLYGEPCEALSDWIAEELGIAKENQTWMETG